MNAFAGAASRRSALSVPGSSPRMLAKAATLPADEIVIDLEDAVAASAKETARDAVVAALRDRALAGRTVAVRANGLGTRWCPRDLLALAELPAGSLDTVVLPKAESAADVAWVARLLDMVSGVGRGPGIQALVETAAGIARAAEIAAASPRVQSLILGYADLRASLGRPVGASDTPDSWRWQQETVLAAARAAGVQAIDGPYLAIDDASGLAAWTEHARALGFDGKWAIHPSQLGPINEVFTPSPAELERARAIVAALQDGPGAVALDGEMIDEATRRQALHVLARATAVEA